MEQDKLGFAECLREAQRLGYAEADPSFDVDGQDTAQKLAILASLAFGTKVDQRAVYVEGISSLAPEDLEWANELGYRVKLLGVAVRTEQGIEQRVHPTMVPKDSALAQIMGVTNAVSVDAEAMAPITLVGPGAGGAATASAVLSDIGDIARGVRTAPLGTPAARLAAVEKAPMVSLPTRPSVPPVSNPKPVSLLWISCTSASVGVRSASGKGCTKGAPPMARSPRCTMQSV